MKFTWLTAPVLASALVVACGNPEARNIENIEETESTSVAVDPAADDYSGAQRLAGEGASASPATDSSAARTSDSVSRSTTGTRAAATRTPAAPRPAERAEAEAPRAAPAPPPVVVRMVTLPAGTSLPLELTSAVSSETAHVEMPVSARLRRAVTVDDVQVLPAGATLAGEVIDVERPGRVQGRARLALRFTSVTVDGRREELRTNPVSFEGEATKREDATKIGAGAGIGAIVGGIVGGGSGAAKGAAIGGAAGTGAVLATRGRDVELEPGTDVTATLASPVDIEVR